MNTHAGRRTRQRARVQSVLQACLVALLINVLVFPPGLLAQAPQSISWNGGTGNWTDNSWTCLGCTAPYPDNNSGFDLGSTYLSTIGEGVVSLDGSSSQQGIQVDNLTLGTPGSTPPPAASLTVGNNILTLGSPSTGGDVLTIYNGGVLNIQPDSGNPGTSYVTLQLQYGTATNSGQINVFDGSSLILETGNGGNISSTFNDNTGLSVGSSTGANLYVYGAQTTISGNGTLSLVGSSQISGDVGPGGISGGGPGSLINDTGHTISGTGSITTLNSFTNNGFLTETGGLAVSNLVFTNNGTATATTSTSKGLTSGQTFDTSSLGSSFTNN